MQLCNTDEFGPVDLLELRLLLRAHGHERDLRTDSRCRGLAAAVVALELGFGGRPRVAMA
jgi:hypothetical protein